MKTSIFMQGFFFKNNHTATEQNSGSGYRSMFKNMINFRPVQQFYKETEENI